MLCTAVNINLEYFPISIEVSQISDNNKKFIKFLSKSAISILVF